MINNHAEYKCETPYKVPFFITQFCTNGTVTLQCGAIKIRCNIRRIKPHTFDTSIEYINLKNNDLQRHIRKVLVIYFCIILNLVKKYIIGCTWRP